ncbi:MAG: FtsX-like permease family protein, partial [Paludibacteraceae bacterium]|nr:FtsX-like permease family protein [Paludibacteraceae bacterium]
IRILIWIVGLGTLTAGMVGISNIMLVTVKERTQEIGVRRALGASPYVIIRQIMSESLVLALIAGLLGLMTGVIISAVADHFLNSAPSEDSFIEGLYVPFDIAVSVLIILVVSGLLSGLMPAYRAIKIKAIDALRDE